MEQGIISVLSNLRGQLERSRQLTQSFNEGDGKWRDGMESGLEAAIEALEKVCVPDKARNG
jgi:hypothetical protein